MRLRASVVASTFSASKPRSITRSRSSGLRLSSTYTCARESSAPITSNDGFSVVAPMNVNRPDSTCGRNASCCALLKRCTSSTKRMVERPYCSRASRERSTASRISFTPDSTAEIAMNSVLNALAMRRASVVLPTPGGPQRIIEWGLPGAKRDPERAALAQQVLLAHHLLDGLRPQPLGERDVGVAGFVEKIALHGPILPLIQVDRPRPAPFAA